ncbi:MAG: putative DNA-binding domain-containing protein [Burkholderiaceae bacterium]
MKPQTLAEFQDGFSQMLQGTGPLPPGLAVYRNTVVKGWVDALQANYPAACRLVGEPFFRQAAVFYARLQPAGEASLLRYGADFAGYLAGYEPAAALPYLPGVARLDRYWIEAHIAPDAQALTVASLAGMAPECLAERVLAPHPAARWAWFGDQPAYTIWRRNRPDGEPEAALAWHGEGALLVRPDRGAVAWHALSQAGCVLLDACAAGYTLGTAAAMALEADSRADIAQLLATLLSCGAFADTESSST